MHKWTQSISELGIHQTHDQHFEVCSWATISIQYNEERVIGALIKYAVQNENRIMEYTRNQAR